MRISWKLPFVETYPVAPVPTASLTAKTGGLMTS